jgi:hypothetical protein
VPLEGSGPQRGLDRVAQFLGTARFEEEPDDTGLVDRARRRLDRAVAGQQDPCGGGKLVRDEAEELGAGHARHTLVGNDHVDGAFGELLQRGGR